MTCPSPVLLARHADRALPADTAAQTDQHLMACPSCRARIDDLAAERLAISRALKATDGESVVPAFVPGLTIGALATWLGGFGLAAWAVNLAWSSVAESLAMPGWLDWLLPDMAELSLGMLLGLAVRLLGDGAATLDTAMVALRDVALLAAALTAIWLVLGRIRTRSRALCLTVAISLTGLAAAPQSEAFELRHDDERVTVAATETIDDTLIVSADRILIEGAVTGDLIAVGEEVTVRGPVGGSLVAFAESVFIESEVDGNVITAAESVDFSGAGVGGNLYGAGETITIRKDNRIDGNAALAAQTAALESEIGRDLWIAAERAILSGSLLGSLRAIAETVELTDGASVKGDIYAKVATEESLIVSTAAEVGGAIRVEALPEPENPYLTPKYYFGILLKIAAALLTGMLLFQLFPSLDRTQIGDGRQAATAAAAGAIALIATPVLALLATITLIGAPVGLTVLAAYLIALYLAGIVTANQIGRLLLDGGPGNRLLPLLAGLGIVFVLINLPLVGGVFRFAALIVGLGLLVLWLRDLWQTREG